MMEGDLFFEDVLDSKVREIQRVFRARRSRRVFRELVLASFVKEYDQDGHIVYKNKVSGATQSTKPRCLGQDDLPNPVKYHGYALPVSRIRQVALVVHCSLFLDKKIPHLTHARNDHRALRDTLVNPYLSNFREEDCFFLQNPTTQAVRSELAAVATAASSADVLFLYVSTHVVYSKIRRKNFFCFTDTNLTHLERTSISAEEFCTPVAKVVTTANKLVVLDCCHRQRPKDIVLKFKILYPNKNFYVKVANLANSHVVGSCNLGARPSRTSDCCTQSDDELTSDSVEPMQLRQKENKSSFSILPRMHIDVDESGEATVKDEIDVVRNCSRRCRDWMARLPRTTAASMLHCRQRSKKSRVSRQEKLMANYETAGYDDMGNSYFGDAVVRALVQATATVVPGVSRPRISIESFFSHVVNDVRRQSETRQTPQAAWTRGESEETTSISFAPCETPPPRAPYALEAPKDRQALLAWDNSPFSGAPPIQYELQSLGTTKYTSREWSPCASFATIETNRFCVPHLVPGLAVRFRVRAKNYGGWSDWSDPSGFVVPRVPFGDDGRGNNGVGHRRYIAANGLGIPSIVQSMRSQATISEVQREGARQLAAVATREHGFAIESFEQERLVEVLLDAMRRFARDPEMQAIACLVLGWCFSTTAGCSVDSGGGLDEEAEAAERLVEEARLNFPGNVAVVCNAGWALSRLKKMTTTTTASLAEEET